MGPGIDSSSTPIDYALENDLKWCLSNEIETLFPYNLDPTQDSDAPSDLLGENGASLTLAGLSRHSTHTISYYRGRCYSCGASHNEPAMPGPVQYHILLSIDFKPVPFVLKFHSCSDPKEVAESFVNTHGLKRSAHEQITNIVSTFLVGAEPALSRDRSETYGLRQSLDTIEDIGTASKSAPGPIGDIHVAKEGTFRRFSINPNSVTGAMPYVMADNMDITLPTRRPEEKSVDLLGMSLRYIMPGSLAKAIKHNYTRMTEIVLLFIARTMHRSAIVCQCTEEDYHENEAIFTEITEKLINLIPRESKSLTKVISDRTQLLFADLEKLCKEANATEQQIIAAMTQSSAAMRATSCIKNTHLTFDFTREAFFGRWGWQTIIAPLIKLNMVEFVHFNPKQKSSDTKSSKNYRAVR